MKWLQQVQCPLPPPARIAFSCCGHTDVSILQWLQSVQPQWFNNRAEGNGNIVNKTWLLNIAAEYGDLAVMQWLRCELHAQYSAVAEIICDGNLEELIIVPDWNVEAAIWALENGLQFEFECSNLDPEKHTSPYHKANATLLWQWLHKESNRHRCTCSNAVVS
jgi:hypothetical protein